MEQKTQTGFTLIELMIVVAIVAILAAIAYPAYRDQVQKSHRADCASSILSAANALERYYSMNNGYAGATLGANGVFSDTCPAGAATSGATVRYNLALAIGANGLTYTLTATPTSAQTGDGCANLTYTNTGVKGVSGTKTVAQCWGN